MTEMTMKASLELSAPFEASDLRDFFSTVPGNALTTVTTHMGGDQRDPYPVGYHVQATW